MGDFRCKLLKPALPAGNLGAKQLLMMAVVRFASEVLAARISDGPRPARQNILDPPLETGLFLLRIVQSALQGSQDGSDARAVGFSIAIGRACLELRIVPAASKQIVGASPQKQLKHRFVSHAKPQKTRHWWAANVNLPEAALKRHDNPSRLKYPKLAEKRLAAGSSIRGRLASAAAPIKAQGSCPAKSIEHRPCEAAARSSDLRTRLRMPGGRDRTSR